jgi:hypothetical protein
MNAKAPKKYRIKYIPTQRIIKKTARPNDFLGLRDSPLAKPCKIAEPMIKRMIKKMTVSTISPGVAIDITYSVIEVLMITIPYYV